MSARRDAPKLDRRRFVRRSVAGGLAVWSTPIITTLGAAPAAAGSVTSSYSVTATRPLATQGWTNQLLTGTNPVDQACFTPTALITRSAQMVGINSDPATDASYLSIDYAFYILHFGTFQRVYVFENGAYVGVNVAFAAGDQFCIIRDAGGTVRYEQNGGVIHTSAMTSLVPLYVDSSFYSTNAGTWSVGSITIGVVEC